MLLEPKQQQTLKLICETLVPSIESNSFSPAATSLSDAEQELLSFDSKFAQADDHYLRRLETAKPEEFKATARLLRLIEIPIICFLATGFLAPFSKLSLPQRVTVLRNWNRHRNPDIRKFFQSIKRLTLFLAYAKPNEAGVNPAWPAIGYTGQNPLPRSSSEDSFQPFQIGNANDIECEVLIVGSGAGGAVAASELAESGHDCVIAEKANWIPRSDFADSEFRGNSSLFDKYGTLASDDLAVVILSGSSVGGGTTVNWMTCLEPTDQVRQQWADDFGFQAAVDGTLQVSIDAVMQRLSVDVTNTRDNPQNAKLRRGCEQLGLRHQTIPRNAIGCGDCGFCGFGCRQPGKQDTRKTYLASAVEQGARLIAGTTVNQIVHQNGKITGARATVESDNGPREVTIRCRAVVCGGGSIQTPALLLRSGLQHRHLGNPLFLHPTTAMVAYYDQPIVAWSGQPQTVVCDHFADLDGAGHGVRFETAPLHPGFGAMALAWDGPLQHKKLLARLKSMANTIVLCRDAVGGRVSIDSQGQPEIQYSLGQQEAKHLLIGAGEAAKIHHAAGAHTIIGPHQQLCFWTRQTGQFLDGEPGQLNSFAELPKRIVALGARPNHLSLFSAHQMSTCRISGSSADGCLGVDGQWPGIANLFVCDGSILPTSCGVNPMITIMGMSHLVSQMIKSQLGN